jgi:hypothetical protein
VGANALSVRDTPTMGATYGLTVPEIQRYFVQLVALFEGDELLPCCYCFHHCYTQQWLAAMVKPISACCNNGYHLINVNNGK